MALRARRCAHVWPEHSTIHGLILAPQVHHAEAARCQCRMRSAYAINCVLLHRVQLLLPEEPQQPLGGVSVVLGQGLAEVLLRNLREGADDAVFLLRKLQRAERIKNRARHILAVGVVAGLHTERPRPRGVA
eukprot:COSAG04_NODE_12271_length_661_cov_0.916370_1_plen_131_part_10